MSDSIEEKRLGGRFGTMADFWLWAFGDLQSNNVRGVFAEWMVAQILGLQPSPRGSWDDYDILLPDGRTIEVKASAYLQVWHRPGDPSSKILFTGLKGHRWLDETQRRSSTDATYNADLYVFCVQTKKERDGWDAFDLAQWDFHLVARGKLEDYGASSLSLSTVQGLTSKLSADELRTAILGAVT